MASAFSTARDSSPKSARRGSFTATTLARRTTSSHSKPSGRTRQIAAFASPSPQANMATAWLRPTMTQWRTHSLTGMRCRNLGRAHAATQESLRSKNHRDAGATSNALTGDRFRPAAPPAVIHTTNNDSHAGPGRLRRLQRRRRWRLQWGRWAVTSAATSATAASETLRKLELLPNPCHGG